MTTAVILAAGRSSRMGRPKALLAHADPDISFVTHLIAQVHASGLATVLVVGRAEDEPLRSEVGRAGATFVVNPRADDGQLSSLVCGIDEAQARGADAVLVIPVDVPLIEADTIRKLLVHAARTGAAIVRATHGGRHGHPVVFTAAVFDELRRADPAVGAKAVVRADPSRVEDVEVGEGATLDIDTPDDYRRAFGRDV